MQASASNGVDLRVSALPSSATCAVQPIAGGAGPAQLAESVTSSQRPAWPRCVGRAAVAPAGGLCGARARRTWDWAQVRATDGVAVTPPAHRFDIGIEADVIEEVARIAALRRSETDAAVAQSSRLPEAPRNSCRRSWAARGYQKRTAAFVDPVVDAPVPAAAGLVLSNPIAVICCDACVPCFPAAGGPREPATPAGPGSTVRTWHALRHAGRSDARD